MTTLFLLRLSWKTSWETSGWVVYVLYTPQLYTELKSMGRNQSYRRSEVVSFIVRCWPHLSAQGTVWRGEVEHVRSGRKEAFQGLDRVMETIQRLMQSLQLEGGGNEDA